MSKSRRFIKKRLRAESLRARAFLRHYHPPVFSMADLFASAVGIFRGIGFMQFLGYALYTNFREHIRLQEQAGDE